MAKRTYDQGMKPPYFIRLASTKDLGRLVCAMERVPLPTMHMNTTGGGLLVVQLDLFRKRPIFYFVEQPDFTHHLGYRNTAGVEEVILSDNASNPALIYSPVISVKRLPSVIEKGLSTKKPASEKAIPIEVGNLASLAKICSYKTIFEEPPLPIFAFQSNGEWILSTLSKVDDHDQNFIFFYLPVATRPEHNFLKYSSLKVSDASLTDKIEEHGYVYVKIIRLAEEHPLFER